MEKGLVSVWDPLVRIGHWALVTAFVVAYLIEGEPMAVHSWAGYVIGIILLVRVLWGFVGRRHARFGDFLYSPGQVLRYLRDLAGFRSRRYIGHSPAGGAMTIALLLMLAATVTTGMLAYGETKHAGPLAFLYPAPVAAAEEPLFPALDEAAEDSGAPAGGVRPRRAEPPSVELHETLVNGTLLLILLHIGGVVLASFAHRENLARAMVTGRKRLE